MPALAVVRHASAASSSAWRAASVRPSGSPVKEHASVDPVGHNYLATSTTLESVLAQFLEPGSKITDAHTGPPADKSFIFINMPVLDDDDLRPCGRLIWLSPVRAGPIPATRACSEVASSKAFKSLNLDRYGTRT